MIDINEILESHKKWLSDEVGGRRADLLGADLLGADLLGADLYGANLWGANLRGADLRGADLRGADLYGANLWGANLRHADLRRANLLGADLRGADLRGADLYGANLWLCTGNRREIRSLFISEVYPITYTAEFLQIGCERHKIADWWSFNDNTIASMDDGALDWWRENKEFIRMAIRHYPATPTGKETTQ